MVRQNLSPDLSTLWTGSPATRLANTSAIRASRNPILISSPARAGHSASMKAIFKTASLASDASTSSGRCSPLYPQLANISRACTSDRSGEPSPRDLPFCLPSIESGSGDSSMNIDGSAPDNAFAPSLVNAFQPCTSDKTIPTYHSERRASRTEESNGMQYQNPTGSPSRDAQLLDMSYASLNVEVPAPDAKRPPSPLSDQLGHDSIRYSQDPPSGWRDALNGTSGPPSPAPHCHISGRHGELNTRRLQDSQSTPRNGNDRDQSMGDLSPNVCVERGPSRHHSNRSNRRLFVP